MKSKGDRQVTRLKRNGFIKEILKNKVLYIMFLPVALWFIAFAYVPMGGIVIAFKDYNNAQGILWSDWNGIDNFKYLFLSGKALLVTLNTLKYNIIFLTCYTIFSLLVALMLAEMTGKWFKKIAQSFTFLPYFVSWVVVSSFLYNFFNYEFGTVNTLLNSFGMEPVNIYSNVGYWYFILPFLYVWKWVGYGSVLYLSAIMGIDQECYEAATIDGANSYQKIFRITLPLLKPTVIILVLLGVGRIMRGEFDMFYNLIGNNGPLMDGTDIIDTLVFRSLAGTQDFGMASASGMYQSVLCFVIIMVVNTIAKKIDADYALF